MITSDFPKTFARTLGIQKGDFLKCLTDMNNTPSDTIHSSIRASLIHNTQSSVTSIARSIDTVSEKTEQKDDRENSVSIYHADKEDKDTSDSKSNSICNNNTSTNNKQAILCPPSTINEKTAYPFSTSVENVASVADKREENSEIHQSTKPNLNANKADEVRLPALPCAWYDYKNPIEFDLGNHLQANHKQELIKLPIGKGSMETRVDHAIQWAKRKVRFEYADDDDDDDEDNEDDSDSNYDYE